MSIHSAIKALRERAHLSQEELGKRVALLEGLPKPLTRPAVGQWEKDGGTAPKRKRLDYVAQVLGTTTERLLAGNPEPLGAEPDPARQRLLERLRTADAATLRLVELALLEDDEAAAARLSPSLRGLVGFLKQQIAAEIDPHDGT